ncbi:MAG TPA: MATE family efflux transporter [Feifaniaceae bacterium]|nr:MATE family efflux transporter [Feifaniaceae bacterium]
MNMTEGKPLRHIVLFALPVMLGILFQQLYQIADAAVVGHFIGVGAFAAVGMAGNLYWVVFSITLGFAQGFGTLFAQRFGAGDEIGLRRAVAQSVLLTAVLGAGLTAVCLPLLRPLLTLLNTPAEIAPDAHAYLAWMLWGLPAAFFYNTASAVLRALGNSRAPLVAVILASVWNVALDLLFVGAFQMGVAGAACATVLATLFSLFYCLSKLRQIPLVRVQKADFTVNGGTARELMRLSAPLAFRNAVIGAGGLVMQYVMNGYGTLFVAGISAANKYFGVMNLAGSALDAGFAVFVGQNYGAGQIGRIKEGMRAVRRIAVASAAVIAAVTILFGKSLVGLLVAGGAYETAQVMEYGYHNLIGISVCLPALYLLYTARSALQGMGNSVIPMVSGFVELLLRLLSVLILPVRLGVWGIYFAEGIGWTGAAILLCLSYSVVFRKRAAALQTA